MTENQNRFYWRAWGEVRQARRRRKKSNHNIMNRQIKPCDWTLDEAIEWLEAKASQKKYLYGDEFNSIISFLRRAKADLVPDPKIEAPAYQYLTEGLHNRLEKNDRQPK